MRLHGALFLMAVTFGLGACDDDISDVRSAVELADLEVADHYATIAASASLPDARAAIDRHEVLIEAGIRDIRVNLDDSEPFCDEDDLERAWDVVAELERRIGDYLDEAGDVASLDLMIDSSAAYRDDMEALFDDMDRRVDDVDCL